MKHEHRSSQNSFGKQSDFYIMNWQQKHENSLKKWANHATWWKLAQADNTIQEHLHYYPEYSYQSNITKDVWRHNYPVTRCDGKKY